MSVSMAPHKRARTDAKLAHPTWSLLADRCPKCDYPEAPYYCDNCGWSRAVEVKMKRGKP